MTNFSTNPIASPSAAAITRPKVNGHNGHPGSPTVHSTTRRGDRVEFSQTAQLLSRLQDLPDIRFDLVSRVKAEIAAGTYETSDKIDAALDGLLDDLR